MSKAPAVAISALSAIGSLIFPQSVMLFLVLAIAPSNASENAEIKNKIRADLWWPKTSSKKMKGIVTYLNVVK